VHQRRKKTLSVRNDYGLESGGGTSGAGPAINKNVTNLSNQKKANERGKGGGVQRKGKGQSRKRENIVRPSL